MILTALHDLIFAVLGVLVLALPTYTPPAGISLSVLSAANFILPLSELGLLMTAVGAYVVATLTYTLVKRGINWLRGAG